MAKKKEPPKVPEYMIIKDFLSRMRDAKQRYNMAVADVEMYYKQEDDIRHAVENTTDRKKQCKLSRLHHEIRVKRRKAKNLVGSLQAIVNWFDSNQPVINELGKVQGAAKKEEERLNTRIYANRTTVLQDAGLE